MGGYGLVLIVIIMILGVFLGVTTRFYGNFGENIAKTHMKEWGFDDNQTSDGDDDGDIPASRRKQN